MSVPDPAPYVKIGVQKVNLHRLEAVYRMTARMMEALASPWLNLMNAQ